MPGAAAAIAARKRGSLADIRKRRTQMMVKQQQEEMMKAAEAEAEEEELDTLRLSDDSPEPVPDLDSIAENKEDAGRPRTASPEYPGGPDIIGSLVPSGAGGSGGGAGGGGETKGEPLESKLEAGEGGKKASVVVRCSVNNCKQPADERYACRKCGRDQCKAHAAAWNVQCCQCSTLVVPCPAAMHKYYCKECSKPKEEFIGWFSMIVFLVALTGGLICLIVLSPKS